MKVLFLSTQNRIDRSRSAYTHRLEKLFRALQKLAIQTEFVSLQDKHFGRPILAQPLNLPYLRKKITNCDFIHAGDDAAYVAALWKPFTKARIIHDVHGDTVSEAQLKWKVSHSLHTGHMFLQSWITNAISFRHADHFLTVSKPMQQWLMAEKNILPHRMCLIRNGVDLELFSPQPYKLTNRFTVCYAGGFQDWQGINTLINAVELLPKNDVLLKIIGFTKRQTTLKSAIAERLGDRVELVDRVSQRGLISQLTDVHVLIIPRFNHPAIKVALPTKFAEYLALGRPVIVCNVDETAHIVRKHRCGLVSEPSPDALAETIQLASNLTQVELEKMGDNGRCMVESEFSWDVIGRKYADFLTRWSES